MRMFRKIASLAIVATMAASLGGCGKSASSDNSGDKGSKTILTLATWANEREAKEVDELLDKLNNAQDEYEIQQQVIPSDYYTKIQTQIAGQQAPDLMWLAQEYVPVYAKNEAVLSLDDMLQKQDKIDMDDFLKGPLDAAKYDGKTYGLPWIGQPYVVYYNKTMFEENGVELPTMEWTWNDFYETAKKLTNGNTYGFATTGNPPLEVFQWGYGGDTIDKDGNVVIGNNESIEGLKFAANMLNDKTAVMPNVEAQSIGVEQGFVQGNIAMMVGGAADDVERKVREAGDKFEVGMAVMPAGPKEHVSFNWTASTVVSSQTKNQEVAQKALLDLTNAMFDYKIPAPVASKIDMVGKINPDKEYAMDVIKKSSEIARGFNNQPTQNEIGTYTWESVASPILTNNDGKGNLDIEKIAKDAQKKLEEITSK